MIKICVSGSIGKMGSRIVELAKEDPDFHLCGCFDAIEENPEQFIEATECLIEFTTPQATMEHLALCEKHKKAMVIGTTGLSESEKEKINAASAKIPVVFSPNMSIGVNLLFKMAGDAAKVLGPEYNVTDDIKREIPAVPMNLIAAYMLHALAWTQSMGKLFACFQKCQEHGQVPT